jgi:glycosyltransferase involved in cell wall biosynthesis
VSDSLTFASEDALANMLFRVGLVTDIFARAGAQRVMASLANALVEKDVRVGIYCLDRTGEAETWLSDSVDVHVIGRQRGKALDWKCVSKLRGLLQEHRVDIVQSHNWSTLLEVTAATTWNRCIRHVYSEHGGLIIQPSASKLKNFFRSYIARYALENAHKRIAIAQRLRSRLSIETGIAIERIDYLPNGCEMPACKYGSVAEARSTIKDRLGLSTNRFVFGTVARLHEIKRLDWMITAFASAMSKGLDSTLIIVGEGAERPRLEALVNELNIRDHVCFVGEQSDIADWLACMDVYVNSSRSEGMSISILEAMAMGTPILATDVGDSGILVGGSPPAGVLVPAGNLDSLCNGMLSLRGDAQQRKTFGANAQIRFRSEYSVSRMCHRYLQTYRNLLNLPEEQSNEQGKGSKK